MENIEKNVQVGTRVVRNDIATHICTYQFPRITDQEDENFYKATLTKYFEMGEDKLIARAQAQARYRRGRDARLRSERITHARTASCNSVRRNPTFSAPRSYRSSQEGSQIFDEIDEINVQNGG